MTDFSYQLYSSRQFPPLSDTLKMLADLGYAQVEAYGALLEDSDSITALEGGLKETGLGLPTAHVNLEMCRDAPDRVIDIAKRLGIRCAIVPFLMPEDRPADAAGWQAFGAALAEVGKPLKDADLTFAYHNHDFEFVATDTGALPIDLIFDAAPDLAFEFDVAWAVRANADPMATIARHGDRLIAAHLKDIAAPGTCVDEDGWADLGHGTMDWPTLFAALKNAGTRYFIMEHDNPNDDRRFATRALAAAQSF